MDKYHQRARQERYEIVKSLITSKMKEGESVTTHLQRMQHYVDHLLKLNVSFDEELDIGIVLHSFPSCYDQFIMTYHLNKDETTLSQLQSMLRTAESGGKGKSIACNAAEATPVLAIGHGKGRRRKLPQNITKRESLMPGRQGMALKAKLVPMFLLPLIPKRQLASSAMTRGFGREVASNTCRT